MQLKHEWKTKHYEGEPVSIVMDDNKPAFPGFVKTNETARCLLEQLKEPTDREHLVKALTDEYEVDEATATTAVERFLQVLADHGLLEV